MGKKNYSDLITNKLIPNGYYDSTMDVYLSCNDGDQAFYNDILISINTAMIFGAKKTDVYVPGINGDTIYSGDVNNPTSKSIPIKGTLQQIGGLLLRQKQWSYKQKNDARIGVLNSETI